MTKSKNCLGFKGHRFPPEIIEHAVWLYFRFSLSLRDVEDLLAERGIIVSHETVRFWVVKFGHQYAKSIRRNRPQVGDKWHFDEVAISIRGKKHWLWRAVDQNGPFVNGGVKTFHWGGAKVGHFGARALDRVALI